MKNMREIALVPLEEWEKVKSLSNQREMKVIQVPQMKNLSPNSLDLKSPQKIKKKKKKTKTAVVSPPVKMKIQKTEEEGVQNQEEEKDKKKKKAVSLPLQEKKIEKLSTNNKVSQPLLRIEHFSPKYRKEASKFLKYLKRSKKVAYNDKLELIFNKKVIPFSNIVQLIEHALNKNNQSKLKGMNRFYNILKKINFPSQLIKNPLGQIIINKKITQK